VKPLFTAAATERELNAIESEHTKNLQQDSWRINQIMKLRFNAAHPAAKFGTGNKFTLKDSTALQGIDLRARLLEFHETYYSANQARPPCRWRGARVAAAARDTHRRRWRSAPATELCKVLTRLRRVFLGAQMTLAVCGRDDLDTLEKWVTDKFADVPNRDVPPPEAAWGGKVSPIDVRAAARSEFSIVPVQDDRSLDMEWVIPFTSKADREARLAAKPQVVLASLLGHEGKGSLLSYLKDTRGAPLSSYIIYLRTARPHVPRASTAHVPQPAVLCGRARDLTRRRRLRGVRRLHLLWSARPPAPRERFPFLGFFWVGALRAGLCAGAVVVRGRNRICAP
jgi:insulysin